MSANRNPESLQGEFHSRVPPSEPLEKGGHKPGVMVGNDRVPEFHAETYPPGTAPREDTYQPRPEGEFSAQAYGTAPSAADTIGGATSQDVYQGMGKPLQGQEAREINKRHGGHNKKSGTGFAGVGGSQGVDSAREKGADLPEGVYRGMRGKGTDEYPGAGDRVPASAEEVASERKVPERAYDYTQSR
ncbi:hypothetical protein EKO27_g10831 [Xylaria grammica]|uniref:Uncharacterized protein n=1 Tax=Xylaria grammica TaxID=363999 RepID=A0A439CQ42_9PEZI|nr:hypothetical protein EKO27_g10831 [Xylaria grammica]